MIREIEDAIAGERAPATGKIFKTTMNKPRKRMKKIANVIVVFDSLLHGTNTMPSGNKLRRPLSLVRDRHTRVLKNIQL